MLKSGNDSSTWHASPPKTRLNPPDFWATRYEPHLTGERKASDSIDDGIDGSLERDSAYDVFSAGGSVFGDDSSYAYSSINLNDDDDDDFSLLINETDDDNSAFNITTPHSQSSQRKHRTQYPIRPKTIGSSISSPSLVLPSPFDNTTTALMRSRSGASVDGDDVDETMDLSSKRGKVFADTVMRLNSSSSHSRLSSSSKSNRRSPSTAPSMPSYKYPAYKSSIFDDPKINTTLTTANTLTSAVIQTFGKDVKHWNREDCGWTMSRSGRFDKNTMAVINGVRSGHEFGFNKGDDSEMSRNNSNSVFRGGEKVRGNTPQVRLPSNNNQPEQHQQQHQHKYMHDKQITPLTYPTQDTWQAQKVCGEIQQSSMFKSKERRDLYGLKSFNDRLSRDQLALLNGKVERISGKFGRSVIGKVDGGDVVEGDEGTPVTSSSSSNNDKELVSTAQLRVIKQRDMYLKRQSVSSSLKGSSFVNANANTVKRIDYNDDEEIGVGRMNELSITTSSNHIPQTKTRTRSSPYKKRVKKLKLKSLTKSLSQPIQYDDDENDDVYDEQTGLLGTGFIGGGKIGMLKCGGRVKMFEKPVTKIKSKSKVKENAVEESNVKELFDDL